MKLQLARLIVALTALLLLFQPTPVAAQSTLEAKTDSLNRLLNMASNEKKTEIYKQLYRIYRDNGDADGALEQVDRWIAHEQAVGDAEEEGRARWCHIVILSNYGRSEEIIEESDEQMAWFADHQQWTNYYNAWVCKVESFYYSRKVQTALREAKEMQEDATQRDNNMGRALAYQQLSTIYSDMGQTDLATESLRKSIDLLKQEDDKDATSMVSASYDYLCQALDGKNDYANELSTCEEWKNYLDKVEDKVGRLRSLYISCYVTKANALVGLERTAEAEDMLQQAEELLKLSQDPINHYRIFLARANLNVAKGNYQQALAYNDSVRAMGDDFGGGEVMRAEILLKMGRAEEAAQLFQRLLYERDTIYTTEIRSQTDELSALFQKDELVMKNRLMRSRLITALIGTVALALLIFILFYWRSAKLLKTAHQHLLQAHNQLEQRNEELAVANERAEESSKMKSEFIKNISHEIRTPLNILSGFSQIITSGQKLSDEEQNEIRYRINENTDRITGLVNKMLALADANSQTKIERDETVTVASIALAAVSETRIADNMAPAKADSPVSFNLQTPDDTLEQTIQTSLHYATESLKLLLDNAQRFTKQGSVTLSVQIRQDQGEVGYVVEDTGCGVPADMAEHIFDEFVQVDSYADGTGIGLTIARNIARRLGGDIRLDTSYQGGARFVMTLPLA